jgi:hypothetical protein
MHSTGSGGQSPAAQAPASCPPGSHDALQAAPGEGAASAATSRWLIDGEWVEARLPVLDISSYITRCVGCGVAAVDPGGTPFCTRCAAKPPACTAPGCVGGRVLAGGTSRACVACSGEGAR